MFWELVVYRTPNPLTNLRIFRTFEIENFTNTILLTINFQLCYVHKYNLHIVFLVISGHTYATTGSRFSRPGNSAKKGYVFNSFKYGQTV